MNRLTFSIIAFTAMSLTTACSGSESVTSFKAPYPAYGEIERLDAALDSLLPAGAGMEKLTEGYRWTEGPIWSKSEGYLLFSDIPNNSVFKWKDGEGASLFLKPSGFAGGEFNGREPGSNGLIYDAEGRLVLCQHGNRQVAKLADDGKSFIAVADRFEGKRLNSPNDLVYDENGNLFFTDPPYGMANDAVKEIDFQGVYRVTPDGKVTLVSKELERPNGIALSPDEKTLYVANSHGPRPIIMAFDLKADGTVGPGRVFFNCAELSAAGRQGAPDGMAIDKKGNLWATGPGGVLVINPSGKHLGTLLTGVPTANCKFGDDGSTLYITANNALVRIRTKATGLGF
jgi:gluconolactonase